MGATYTRQEASNITDGSVIEASHLNNELNQLLAAFASSTGHSHDGTAAEGGYVPLIADSDANNKILVDTSSNRFGVFVEVSSNPVEQFRFQDGAIVPVTDNDIDLGTSSLEFKDAYFDGVVYTDSLALPTTTITDILDEDNMASNSATALATQQSIKAYVDSQVTAQDLDFQGDSGGALSIDLDSETLDIAGGTGIDTSGSGNTLTVAIDSTVATLTGTQTLTNKTLTTPTISSITNTGTLTLPTSTDTLVGRATTDTLTNKTLTSAVLNGTISGTSIKDEDDMTSNSASHLATQQSIKAYVDSQVQSKDALSELSGDSDDITEGTTNLFFTNERVDDRVNSLLTAGSNITLTYDDTANTLTVASTDTGITDVVSDTTPQLGGDLDVNGSKITSATNGDIDIEPNGTGNVLLGNFEFDVDQTVGASQDNYVLTYDNSTGHISLEEAASGISDVVDDTTPQLGGDLDTNGNLISFPDSASASADRLKFGTGNDTSIYHTGTTTFIQTAVGATTVIDTPAINIKYGAEFLATFSGNDSVDLYFNNSKKFETTNTGVTITGDLTVSGDDIIMGTNTDTAIMVADGTNFNPVVPSGDITLTNAGVFAIASGAIVNDDINASAAIADSKLATITTADKVSGAAIQVDGATDGTGITVASTDKLLVDDGGTTKYINVSQLPASGASQGFAIAMAVAL